MKRLVSSCIYKDISQKIVLILGPRQCGKTTLARSLYPDNCDYYNFDSLSDRETILAQAWDRQKKLIIFDELHKMTLWKRWLKGVYDTEGIPPELIVTGSAKLNVFKKVGDSLAGRYFQFHLHPFDLKEIALFAEDSQTLDQQFEQLWNCSGFPEPYLKNSPTYYKRWASTHLDVILKQDLIDLFTVHDLKSIETLVLLLKNRVGGSVSYSHLARDLQKDVNTIKRWLDILEELYIIYRVTPYSKNIARSLLKEPKFYFYDHNQVTHDDGAKLENIVANALIKELDFIRDTQGSHTSLHYLRTKDGKEIDFLICIDDQPTHMIEVKSSDDDPGKSFTHFANFMPKAKQLQLVKTLKREKTFPDGLEIRALVPWLKTVDLS